MKNSILILTLLFGFTLNALAQNKSSKELKGDKLYFRYAYDEAIDAYLNAKDLTPDGQRKMAQAYYIIGSNAEAEAVYAKLVLSNGKTADDFYQYAMVLKSQKKYTESNQWMERFCNEKPADLRAKSYNQNKENLAQYLSNNGEYTVTSQSINTASQDFGTAYFHDQIVFASSNNPPKMIKRKYNWNGEPYLELYTTDVKDNQLKNREKFNKKFSGKLHDGPACFSNKGTLMAITRNTVNDKSKDKIVELQISFSTFLDEKWTEPVAFEYNNEGFSTGHPFLTEDGNTMYFISDMPGGYGGTDLYKTTRYGNKWTTPVNLGNKVNTEGDELFPFFEESGQMLIFSSNGHYGLGGQDIFSSNQIGESWEDPKNLGMPINSEEDDFSFIFNQSMDKGYFSSNRSGGKGGDDIYSFQYKPELIVQKLISGTVQDESGKPISDALVTLLGEKEKTLNNAFSDKEGNFSFPVENEKNFELIGNKDGYLEGNSPANSYGEVENIMVLIVLRQTKVKDEDTLVKDEDIVVNVKLEKVAKMNPIYFDYNQSNIRPDAAKELDKIIKIMNKYPTIEVELTSYTDCRGSDEYNMILSENRAKTTVDYIRSKITNPSRISGKGKGETKLINDCSCDGDKLSKCTSEEHQENRRSEFLIIK